MKATDILALDASATCTGWASGPLVGTIVPPKTVGTGVRRLRYIHDAVRELARPLVVIEDYAYNAQSRAVTVLAEVGGVIRLTLSHAGSWIVTIPPSVRQKLATGNGNARKEQVLRAAWQRLGYQGDSYDEADALWLQQMAFQVYRLPEAAALPKSHNPASMKGYREDTWPTAEAIMERWNRARK